jgi:hypothetical protein
MNLVLILFFIFLVLYFYTSVYENFQVVGYNNTIVPDYKIHSIYNLETKRIENILNELNNSNKNYSGLDSKDTFILLNLNINFSLTDIFKNIVLDYIYQISEFKKDKVYILGDFTNIYYKDNIDDSRTFILNADLINPVNFFTRTVQIIIKLNNVSLISTDKFNYINDQNVIKKNSIIQSISLNNTKYENFSYNLNDQLNQNYYLIKNKYHLLDPFLTSGKDMILSYQDKNNFKYTLDGKNKLFEIYQPL